MELWKTITAFALIPAGLTLLTTLNLALRYPVRARIAEAFEELGRDDALKAFVAHRTQYMLATAVLRSASVLLLFVGVLYYQFELDQPAANFGRIVVACVVAWSFLVVFGVAIPYAWSKYSGEWLIVRCLSLLALLRIICYPVIVVLELFDPLIRRLAGVPARSAKSFADELEQEILHIVTEGELHGAVDEDEKEMIESVIELSDKRVAEIMTPRTDVVAIPKDADYQTTVDAVSKSGHSRIPVFENTIDTILGILYAKDLLRRSATEPFSPTRVMRRALFIPESKLVRDLLRELQEQKVHIAVVLDEYGGTAGLVTIEDIIEELVGDIADEYETEVSAELKRIDDRTLEVDARMRLTDLNSELELELPEDDSYETIGGFVLSTLGKIPKVGEQCAHGNVRIQVIAAEPHRVTRLRLKLQPSEEGQPARA